MNRINAKIFYWRARHMSSNPADPKDFFGSFNELADYCILQDAIRGAHNYFVARGHAFPGGPILGRRPKA